MTEKERLEEIDMVVNSLINNRVELTNFVNDYYLQAERVQELEGVKEANIEELGYVDERLLEAERKNKRYREVIKRAFDEEDQNLEGYESNVYEILKEALENESCN